jgi:hypothetical protein
MNMQVFIFVSNCSVILLPQEYNKLKNEEDKRKRLEK